jgi:uncharacterized protein YdeI (YjbR/CyaY-like superfamily)
MNPKVDFFFNKAKVWGEELKMLRQIVLETGLVEELKWGVPTYTFEQKNVVLIHAFKEYVAVLFFKGALLTDPQQLLIIQTENVQAARQLRFTSVAEVAEREEVIKAYIYEAVTVEEAGLKVELKKTEEFGMPEELRERLDSDAAFKTAFEALTPGRPRGYLLHFSAPKQAKTRLDRIEKCTPLIYKGEGLNDEYAKSKKKQAGD